MAQHQSHSMPHQSRTLKFSDFLSLFLVPLSFPSLAFPWGPFSVAATLPILATVMDMSSKDTRPQHQDINHFQKGNYVFIFQLWSSVIKIRSNLGPKNTSNKKCTNYWSSSCLSFPFLPLKQS